MAPAILTSDKAPYLLPITLGIVGWFISTIVANISDVPVVQIEKKQAPDKLTIEFANRSIKTPLNNAYFKFRCTQDACLKPFATHPQNDFVQTTEVFPNAIQGNQTCDNADTHASVLFSLPPGGAIRYTLKVKRATDISIAFAGTSTKCPDSDTRLNSTNLWIYTSPTIVLYIIEYYFEILIALLVLTIGFVGVILAASSPSNDQSRSCTGGAHGHGPPTPLA